MKQIINQCLTAFFMILSMIILICLLLIIPVSTDSAEPDLWNQVFVIGKPGNYKN